MALQNSGTGSPNAEAGEPEHESRRAEVITSLVVSLAAFAVAGGVLKQSQVLASALFFAAGLPWLLFAFSKKVKVWAAQPWVPALLWTLAFASAGVSMLDEPDQKDDPKPSPIKFVHPGGNDVIPHCNQITGTGSIPSGHRIALFDRSLSEANAPYWFDQIANPTDNGWRVDDVQIGEGEGDEGAAVELIAVLLPEKTAQYLASIQTGNGDADVATYWWATHLPAEAVDRVKVTRNADTKECS
ncbi:hypothetical protein E1200_30745 [Actinomadura sp. GC306]|uniref:hypothetical protein n=1 Tax=Actinomadura sp. GC306 TaxID=2530367 RepID=UPI0010486961|nr:hypothetical protein [Actinomadura sp. GC306]TDC60272.1 hypothetical protein E1200_30745 [Actinomadura sp. GC306]